MELNKEKIKSIIGDDFICHFGNDFYGDYVVVMERCGAAMARVYWNPNDSEIAFFDYLSVSPDLQKLGFGTTMQIIQEKIGRALGAKYCRFFVEKDKWMHDWYKRRGYVDYEDYNDEYVWMQKLL